MVERLLRQMLASGITTVTVITGWLGERVEAHLGSLDDLPPGVRISFVRESSPLGTVGALTRVRAPGERVLFAFADLVTELDFSRLLDWHERSGADLTLASHPEMHRLSLGEILSDGHTVTGYLEKPKKEFTICSGIAVLEPRVVKLAAGMSGLYGLPDLVAAALVSDCRVLHWPHGAFWRDVNSPEALFEVNERCGAEVPHAVLATPGRSVDGRALPAAVTPAC
jgi:NDP-sugar pyrophosphorylase family protein